MPEPIPSRSPSAAVQQLSKFLTGDVAVNSFSTENLRAFDLVSELGKHHDHLILLLEPFPGKVDRQERGYLACKLNPRTADPVTDAYSITFSARDVVFPEMLKKSSPMPKQLDGALKTLIGEQSTDLTPFSILHGRSDEVKFLPHGEKDILVCLGDNRKFRVVGASEEKLGFDFAGYWRTKAQQLDPKSRLPEALGVLVQTSSYPEIQVEAVKKMPIAEFSLNPFAATTVLKPGAIPLDVYGRLSRDGQYRAYYGRLDLPDPKNAAFREQIQTVYAMTKGADHQGEISLDFSEHVPSEHRGKGLRSRFTHNVTVALPEDLAAAKGYTADKFYAATEEASKVAANVSSSLERKFSDSIQRTVNATARDVQTSVLEKIRSYFSLSFR